jgi:response regulator RpfG family c-di-GMP phosphodiesterase
MNKIESIEKKKILCISDQADTQAQFSKSLEDTQHVLLSAHHAQEGLALARKHLPDFIFISASIFMAAGEGFSHEISQIQYLESTPLTLLYESEKDQQWISPDPVKNADDFLLLPSGPDTLLPKLSILSRVKTLKANAIDAQQKYYKAVSRLKAFKEELERKNEALLNEKKRLKSSLKQISSMIEEREVTNKKLQMLLDKQKIDFNSLTALLSSAIESKRQYHRGHSKKVAEISVFIGKKFKLSKKEIRHIEIAAQLHEIGKMSIPDDLALKNPRDYTQQEKDFLIQHPVHGAMMLEKFSGFKEVAKIIRYFHENIDGSGVPDSLCGQEIPLGSRIIRVAGAYDNLVHRNQDISPARAFEIIEDRIGSRYDSMVVHFLHNYAHRHPVDEADKRKLYKIIELKPGMVLASGIYTVSGTKLLPLNTVLTEENIHQIAHYNSIEPLQDIVFIKD